ncbi:MULTISPECIES: flagellar hook-associated protein FlgK [unclassified Sphingopyxis]|uniref:flagellar hook-associated protein FlgK n=1 Tax=unclassified Sphingopyxis TaxID=2614943 RepID=UPI0028650898|nr:MULTISPECIES: flagellar hook-associated protein FlgK [unclassified Sphingopyxis]MDR6833473.1 flagellar hook-associated protein 1 FlgK [Sphingopyxis sp. BE122]MDR7225742.1 flagellar hook-associated protein 1 FlgK [Sphingopyxis sp. BE259]
MSDLLGIGYSGLKAYSRALSTIGDNIANAQTPGYARRRLDMMEPVSGSDSVFYRGNINPSGVEIRGVSRSVDAWLIEDSRISGGESERSATKLGWLDKVEGALSDETNGIKTGLTKLFTTADQLTADPANKTLRSQFLQAVDDVASGFRTAAGQLDKMADGIEGAATATVQDFNTNLNALEQINIGLRKARPGSTNEASLLDERDRLLDKLSSQAGVSATFENNGSVTLRAAGSGDLLVGGGVVNPIAVTAAADGRLSYSVGGSPLAIATGSLAGQAEAANHVADQRASLDTMATGFAAQLNAAHQAGSDANGNPGSPLFTGTSAATLAAAALTPEQVAAANASGGNGNMLALGALRGANDPESRWSGHLATQAQTTAAARAQDAAAMTRADASAAARDGVSEVDLDKEAAELLRFQQAYQAAARTIQVARETMQTLLSSI